MDQGGPHLKRGRPIGSKDTVPRKKGGEIWNLLQLSLLIVLEDKKLLTNLFKKSMLPLKWHKHLRSPTPRILKFQ